MQGTWDLQVPNIARTSVFELSTKPHRIFVIPLQVGHAGILSLSRVTANRVFALAPDKTGEDLNLQGPMFLSVQEADTTLPGVLSTLG
jgi:hypothetical protein